MSHINEFAETVAKLHSAIGSLQEITSDDRFLHWINTEIPGTLEAVVSELENVIVIIQNQ